VPTLLMGMRTHFNNILSHDALPLEIRYQRLIDKGGLKVALYVLERVEEVGEEELARRRKAAAAAAVGAWGGLRNKSILTKNKKGEEHKEKSRRRAAARLARGETVGAPPAPPTEGDGGA
jgi:hypothetical protein